MDAYVLENVSGLTTCDVSHAIKDTALAKADYFEVAAALAEAVKARSFVIVQPDTGTVMTLAGFAALAEFKKSSGVSVRVVPLKVLAHATPIVISEVDREAAKEKDIESITDSETAFVEGEVVDPEMAPDATEAAEADPPQSLETVKPDISATPASAIDMPKVAEFLATCIRDAKTRDEISGIVRENEYLVIKEEGGPEYKMLAALVKERLKELPKG